MKLSNLALSMRHPTAVQVNCLPVHRLRTFAAVSLTVLALTGCGFFDGSNPDSSLEAKAAELGRSRGGDVGSGTDTGVPGAGAPASNGENGENGGKPGDTGADQGTDSKAATGPSSGTTGGSKPAPAEPKPSEPVATQPAKVNSVDTMISDMSKLNDLVLKGVDPKYGFARGPGYNIMGNDPRGTNTPDWYKSSYPWMNNGNYWNYLLPWFVQFEGEGNAAYNTRIQMRNMKVFIKVRSTGAWYKVNKSESVGGILCPQGSNYFHCPQSGVLRQESEGVSSLPQRDHNLHGWWGSRESINGPDIAAVVVTLQGRLVVNDVNGVDDRARARYLIQVGADYYPTNGSAETVLPAVGISRAKLLTTEWQSFTMATFNDVGSQEPGGGISSAQMRSNPPPLD